VTTADQILNYLARHRSEAYTAAEIADAIGASPATVAAALRKLADTGMVDTVGVTFSNARTWALTSD
jgi:DNA-binding IclR family transcriptional regulator